VERGVETRQLRQRAMTRLEGGHQRDRCGQVFRVKLHHAAQFVQKPRRHRFGG
jgi:hypothetical protein